MWCNISGGAGGEIWLWSLSGVKGLKSCSSADSKSRWPHVGKAYVRGVLGRAMWEDHRSCRSTLTLARCIGDRHVLENARTRPTLDRSMLPMQSALRWCYTGQLATPIRNACFSHEFADMIHFWIAFKNFQRVAALQISQKIVRNGVLHWNDFLRNIVSLQVGVASWPV